jgi:hypothetical protein
MGNIVARKSISSSQAAIFLFFWQAGKLVIQKNRKAEKNILRCFVGRKDMDKEKAAQRTLEKRDGELWFGAKVEAVLPTPVESVVLISIQEPPDAVYDATHFIKSNEHYISAGELFQVLTDGHGLTDDRAGILLAALIGTRHALATLVDAFDQAQLAPVIDRLRGTEAWSIALSYARYVLDRSHVNLNFDVDDFVLEEHA